MYRENTPVPCFGNDNIVKIWKDTDVTENTKSHSVKRLINTSTFLIATNMRPKHGIRREGIGDVDK